MDFPDFNHLIQLQKYLWEWPDSRASVMVGAGLSLNSKPSPGVSTTFPTWSELAHAMFDEMYPPQSDETAEQKAERERLFNSSNPLRLASEYEAAFERRNLESFLLKKIPNSDHQPGNIHTLLLQLPWKDVFTTNYDTLLERTGVPGRAYQTVTTPKDLTNSFSPRIIKLHGSFPSQTPFIITEEDYRTYPKGFAPFVNTVRQSLIENALVLIGFSGDDPNFLEWTGWIRDELGGYHAPIYLVGPLSIGNVQRSLFKQRGVTPIDLAPVFGDGDPIGGTHASAVEWFLHSLQAAKPKRPEKWSDLYAIPQETADFEPPILTERMDEPEEIDPFTDSKNNLDEPTVMKVIKRWRFERNQYPGWLVPTNEIRTSLWYKTKNWITPLIKFVENRSPADRVLLFREINWRLEISMAPLFSDWKPSFESAVDALFSGLKDKATSTPSKKAGIFANVSEKEVVEAWLEIAFALLREARGAYDSDRWTTLKEMIDQVVDFYPQFTDRHHYEQALWMMWNIERSQAKDVLTKWSPPPHSPLAVMWKAGLLAELDELSEARSLLRTALREIRKSLHNTRGRNIDLLSLEGWCTYLLFSVETAVDPSKYPEIRGEFSERWQELKRWNCDPRVLKQYFDEVVTETRPSPKRGKQTVREFDPGRIQVTHHLTGDLIELWLPAFACIRLYEQAGIPMRLSHHSIGNALKNACKWIAPFSEFWSPEILIRAGKIDALTKHGFMDRTQVATMKPALAKNLNKWATGALKRELSTLTDTIPRGSAHESLLEVLTEVLSRLAFKLELVDLQEAFSLALEVHRHPSIQSHIILYKSCQPWFRRLFEAVDSQQLFAWLPELLKFPLYAERNQLSDHSPWPDPMTCLPIGRMRASRETPIGLPTEIHSTIESLLEHARSESGEERQRAVMRLIYVLDTGLMTEEQKKSLGTLLWEKTNERGLPDLPHLYAFNYLHLPSPEKIDFVSKVKDHILDLTPTPRVVAENIMLLNAAFASKPVVHIPHEQEGIIEWSRDEAKNLLDKSIEWWKGEKGLFALEKSRPFVGTDHLSASLENLGIFLARAVLPNMESASRDEWSKTISFLYEVRKQGVYLTTALPNILLHRQNEKDKVIQTILGDLASGDEEAVAASAKAVRHWSYLADAELIDSLPKSTVDKLIQRTVFRRPEGILTCLDQLALLLVEKTGVFTSDQVNLMVSSLTPWDHATRLPITEGNNNDGNNGDENNGEFLEEERPGLRVELGRLAFSLSFWLQDKFPNQPEPGEISNLRELYRTDPLPEVRRAFDTWKQLVMDSSN